MNKAVKESEDHHKLVELQKRLDRKPIENIQHPVSSEYKVRMLRADYKVLGLPRLPDNFSCGKCYHGKRFQISV